MLPKPFLQEDHLQLEPGQQFLVVVINCLPIRFISSLYFNSCTVACCCYNGVRKMGFCNFISIFPYIINSSGLWRYVFSENSMVLAKVESNLPCVSFLQQLNA